MNDLVTWLRQQLDADERVARRVEPNQAPVDLRAMVTRDGSRPFLVIDSARVLAEVDAKRRIIDTLRGFEPDDQWATQPDMGLRENNAAGALRALALPYADRSGYREEWKP